jgi:hypothetical protein
VYGVVVVVYYSAHRSHQAKAKSILGAPNISTKTKAEEDGMLGYLLYQPTACLNEVAELISGGDGEKVSIYLFVIYGSPVLQVRLVLYPS